jgi:hypothetical protein
VNYKQITVSVKSASQEGVVSVIFATLNTIDRDGDVTVPGAFGNQIGKISPAHDWRAATLGVAKVREDGNHAIADLQFNLEISSAVDWYKSIRFAHENGAPQEYSYGFDVLDSEQGVFEGQRVRLLKKVKVYEVSPVMVGAGLGTQTLSVKTCTTCGGGDPHRPLKFADQLQAALAMTKAVRDRAREIRAKREDQGRIFPLKNDELVHELDYAWHEICTGEKQQPRLDPALLHADCQYQRFLETAKRLKLVY